MATISMDELQKRDAIIAALCVKLGVDASSVINPQTPAAPATIPAPTVPMRRKVKEIPYDKNHQKAIDEVLAMPEGKISLAGVQMSNNGYHADVIVGLAPASNLLTRTLVDAFAVAPFRERLRLGGTSDTERIAGWSVPRRWSGAVHELLSMLESCKQAKKREAIIESYTSSHQELIMAIREWQSIKWGKTAQAKKRKSALRDIFRPYLSVFDNKFATVSEAA